MEKLTVGTNDAGQRLDKFLTKTFRNLPKSMMYKFSKSTSELTPSPQPPPIHTSIHWIKNRHLIAEASHYIVNLLKSVTNWQR